MFRKPAKLTHVTAKVSSSKQAQGHLARDTETMTRATESLWLQFPAWLAIVAALPTWLPFASYSATRRIVCAFAPNPALFAHTLRCNTAFWLAGMAKLPGGVPTPPPPFVRCHIASYVPAGGTSIRAAPTLCTGPVGKVFPAVCSHAPDAGTALLTRLPVPANCQPPGPKSETVCPLVATAAPPIASCAPVGAISGCPLSAVTLSTVAPLTVAICPPIAPALSAESVALTHAGIPATVGNCVTCSQYHASCTGVTPALAICVTVPATFSFSRNSAPVSATPR